MISQVPSEVFITLVILSGIVLTWAHRLACNQPVPVNKQTVCTTAAPQTSQIHENSKTMFLWDKKHEESIKTMFLWAIGSGGGIPMPLLQPTGSQPTGFGLKTMGYVPEHAISQQACSQQAFSQQACSQQACSQQACEPTGLQPTGLQPTGLQPAGLQPTGLWAHRLVSQQALASMWWLGNPTQPKQTGSASTTSG